MCSNFNCHSKLTFPARIKQVASSLQDGFKDENANNEYRRLYADSLVLLEVDALFKKARLIWRQLEDIILCDRGPANFKYISAKNEIVQFLQVLLLAVQDSKPVMNGDQQQKVLRFIKLLKKTVLPLSELEDSSFNKLTPFALAKEESMVFHYFHTYLSSNWLLILIEHSLDGDSEHMYHLLQLFMKDLIALSKKQYSKIDGIVQRNEIDPFLCPCVKQAWVCLQLFIEKKLGRAEIFWDLFNAAAANIEPSFSLWLLYHISLLHGINEEGLPVGESNDRVFPNHDFIENKLKRLCSSSVEDQILLNSLIFIEPLLNKWWSNSAKINPYQILWEYFNKALMSQTANGNIPKGALKLIERKSAITNNLSAIKNVFEFFVGMLVKHLTNHPTQWLKLKGRIYSKLPVQKTNSLNDTGLCQIFLLLTSIAFVDFGDITNRVRNILESLPPQQQNTPMVWSFYMSLIMVYVQNGKNIEGVAKRLTELVNDAANCRDSFHLLKSYIRDVEIVLNLSSSYNLNQHVLLGAWIKKYMTHCHHSDMDAIIQVLTFIAENAQQKDCWPYWETTFQLHVFPAIKQASTSPNAPAQVGKLAAILSKISPELSNQAITYFAGELVAPKICARFVSTLLLNYPHGFLVPNQENFMIQAWVRCCLLSTESQGELTKSIMKLHGPFALVKHKIDAKVDPLCSYIEVLGKQASDSTNLLQIKSLCETSFGNSDSWIKACLKEPTNEPLVIHIYTRMALLVFHCAPLLYCKTKSACLLSRLSSVLLSPPEVLMGRAPHEFILSGIYRTWHLFVKGICTLNWNDDAFLERILKNLVVYYVPHFPANGSPLLKCFDDRYIAAMILQKIASAFFNSSSKCSKESVTNVLRIVESCVAQSSCVYTIQVICQKVLSGVLEFLLFNLNCNAAVCVLRALVASPIYGNVKEDVRQSVLAVTEKHLSFNANNYFQLAHILIRLMPLDMKVLLPSIKQCIVSVEKMRGVGYDGMLRRSLESLESALSNYEMA